MILIQSVLSSFLSYYRSLFKIPCSGREEPFGEMRNCVSNQRKRRFMGG